MFLEARYGQKLEQVRKWLHSEISGWHEDLRPFWTIQDPALWREDGDLMSGNSSSAELRLARAQLLWPKCGTL